MGTPNEIRVVKDREEWRHCGWTSTPNALLLDSRIAWECKGAFGWLSLAADDPDFDLTADSLAAAGPKGRDHAQGLIRTLEQFGWMSRWRQPRPDGTPEIVYRLHTKPLPENERTFRPSRAKSRTRKFPQVNPQKLTGQVLDAEQGDVDNSTNGDSGAPAPPPEPFEVSAGQSPKPGQSGPGQSGPGQSGVLTSPSRKTSSSSLGSSTAAEQVPELQTDEEDEEETPKENPGEIQAVALLGEYARFGRGRFLQPQARAECERLVAERLTGGWNPERLGGYVREWSAQAKNPSTYLPLQLRELPVSPPQARRARTTDKQPAPAEPAASEQARQAALATFQASEAAKAKRPDRVYGAEHRAERHTRQQVTDESRSADGFATFLAWADQQAQKGA